MLGQLVESRLLQRRIVIRIEIVEADNAATVDKKATRDMKPDETSSTSDEDRLIRHRYFSA